MFASYQYRLVCCFAALFVIALTGGPLRAQQTVLHFEDDFEADKGYVVGQPVEG